MSLKRLNKKDYTIGIIVTDPTSCHCIDLLLDEKHDPALTTKVFDINTYILGEMCGQNVVICLYDTTKNKVGDKDVVLQKVVQNFKASFPDVMWHISTGHCNGTPTPTLGSKDIRLGDILIATNGVAKLSTPNLPNKPSSKWLDAYNRATDPKANLADSIGNLRMIIENKNDALKKLMARPEPDKDVMYDTLKTIYRGRVPRKGLGIGLMEGMIGDGVNLFDITVDGQFVGMIHADRKGHKWELLCGIDQGVNSITDEISGCLIVRGVSNYVDQPVSDVWMREASKNSATFVKHLINHLDIPKNVPIAPVAPIQFKIEEQKVLSEQKSVPVKSEPIKKDLEGEKLLDTIHDLINARVEEIEKKIAKGKHEKFDLVWVTEKPVSAETINYVVASLREDNYTVEKEEVAHNSYMLEIR